MMFTKDAIKFAPFYSFLTSYHLIVLIVTHIHHVISQTCQTFKTMRLSSQTLQKFYLREFERILLLNHTNHTVSRYRCLVMLDTQTTTCQPLPNPIAICPQNITFQIQFIFFNSLAHCYFHFCFVKLWTHFILFALKSCNVFTTTLLLECDWSVHRWYSTYKSICKKLFRGMQWAA